MLRRPVFALMLAAALSAHPSAFMDQPAAAPDVDALGPQVGSQVADFALPDQHGRQQSLSTLRGPKGLVLVFNRSADW
jgi:cytochrome oxidase Cu insertion factor (SCO1/SenC/PrrC family)